VKVSLQIADDAELRAAVKDMVRGQLRSIVREDIVSVICEVAGKGSAAGKTPAEKTAYLNKIIAEEVRSQVAGYVKRALSDWNGRDVAKDLIQQEINRVFVAVIQEQVRVGQHKSG
jgi:hypothetical protein